VTRLVKGLSTHLGEYLPGAAEDSHNRCGATNELGVALGVQIVYYNHTSCLPSLIKIKTIWVHSGRSGMVRRDLVKHAAVIAASYLADFFGREALAQHFAGKYVEEPFRQSRPRAVRSSTHSR
jgi:hypothetical protein